VAAGTTLAVLALLSGLGSLSPRARAGRPRRSRTR
jgi:hypothetical protein